MATDHIRLGLSLGDSSAPHSFHTLAACEVCSGEARVYACVGRDSETGGGIEVEIDCEACDATGLVPELAGFASDEECPEDDAPSPEDDPADAPLFVAYARAA